MHGREQPLHLREMYDLRWREYAKFGGGDGETFRYLAAQVSPHIDSVRTKPFLADDPLWDIVGIGHSGSKVAVSSDKYNFLADAYEKQAR